MAQFEFVQWLLKFIESRDFDFEWDTGNELKSFEKHKIKNLEAEEVFYDQSLVILGKQISPFHEEERFGILGKTFENKIVFINFTFRNLNIRVISSREANKKERSFYEKK